jgi:glucose-6-phosphate isomerase
VASERDAWAALRRHYEQIRGVHLRTFFAEGRNRGERLVLEAAGLYLDYSKNRVTEETLGLLIALAEAAGLRARIDAMFSGQKINLTEDRAVLHVALRAPRDRRILVDGVDVVPGVHAVLDRMADFSARVRSGAWTGFTGRHRRLRPWPGHGLRGPAPLQRPAPHPALRLERGRYRLRRVDA